MSTLTTDDSILTNAAPRKPGRKAPARKAPVATPITSASGAPIVLEMNKLTIGDMRTFGKLGSLKSDAEALPMMPEVIDMLDRIVVGGVGHRPAGEMAAIMQEVNRQMSNAGNPKN